MANNRIPKAKAEVSGASAKNPKRFKDRQVAKNPRKVGEPYAKMTEIEKWYWNEYTSECPWLNSSHRVLLRMACNLAARMDTGDVGIEAMKALSSILSKMGATPADESKVSHDNGEEKDDPTAQYFN